MNARNDLQKYLDYLIFSWDDHQDSITIFQAPLQKNEVTLRLDAHPILGSGDADICGEIVQFSVTATARPAFTNSRQEF